MKNEKEKEIVVIGVVKIFLLFFLFLLSNFFFPCAKHMFTLVLVAQCHAGHDALTGILDIFDV